MTTDRDLIRCRLSTFGKSVHFIGLHFFAALSTNQIRQDPLLGDRVMKRDLLENALN